MMQRIIAWAGRNERHIGALLFVAGFGLDVFTFGALSVSLVNYFFLVYLLVTFAAIGATHYLFSEARRTGRAWRSLRVIVPLASQFVIGGLLSGMLVFYTRSGSVLVSWPFLLILLLAFVGNEYYRKYKDRLVFQSLLFYLALYAYILFAIPYYTKSLTSWSFYLSTLVTLVAGALFFYMLYFIGRQRFLDSFKYILASAAVSTLVIVSAYLGGVLPPLPLSLREIGVYHDLERSAGEYVLSGEQMPWYGTLLGQTVHVVPGESLVAFSSVFAPTAFTTTLTHRWEFYDQTKRAWVVVSTVRFPLSGGREEGYRGYSESARIVPGKWRVSVISSSGQKLGRRYFTAVTSDGPVPLVQEFR